MFLITFLSVRLVRGVAFEHALLSDRVRRAEAEIVPPEGVAATEADLLQEYAVFLAPFGASQEATRASNCETASERSFLEIKELRQIERPRQASVAKGQAGRKSEELGSSFPEPREDARSDNKKNWVRLFPGLARMPGPTTRRELGSSFPGPREDARSDNKRHSEFE